MFMCVGQSENWDIIEELPFRTDSDEERVDWAAVLKLLSL